MKKLLEEFKDFINKGDVVVIAVGLIMALYFQQIVDQILEGLIKPIIAAIFGEPSFGEVLAFDINGAEFRPGWVISAAIDFIVVAFILFLLIKAYNSWKSDDEEEDAGPTEIELLTEIRDSLRNR